MKEWAEQMKKALHDRADYKEVLQAAAFFKRMRNSYASSGRSFACQPFSVRTTFRQLEETSDRLSNVIVENQSFETLIPHYDREDSFFYLDPPYFKSEYVYEAEFGWEQHVLLRDTLANCKGKWLVSQSDFPEVRELFKDYYTPLSPDWICYENLPDPVRYNAWNLEREMFLVLDRAVDKYGLSYMECRFPKLDGSNLKRK